ncbi:MAG: cell wall-binding repeat-containing protein, partial [Acidimicrobiia bacterium]|nr:cell wall-binding repeat-containing protein [Acidimicrobiia bacterium]
AAGARGGPVLLTDPDVVPTATKNELARLAPAEIVLVGGTAVVSDAVLTELRTFAPTTRASGSDRFTTAEEVSKGAFTPSTDVVYIATGFDFPDALSAGAAGGLEGGPILLTAFDEIPTATLREIQRLKPSEIVVVGGSAVISDGVVAQFNSIVPTIRAAGAERYATAAAVSARIHPPDQPVVYLATGLNFPDALAAAATAAALGAPILLTGDLVLPSATKTELSRLSPETIIVVGGSSAVSQSVIAELITFTD